MIHFKTHISKENFFRNEKAASLTMKYDLHLPKLLSHHGNLQKHKFASALPTQKL